ncbi:FimV/HubP family polar landmark protein [Nitrosococcus wardiae]|uniref:Tetratricopeptide repeat protein n=1 Tax=Nitrosococcus wardiae TaxID=1814290 RepID=A0A4P7C1W4_9GAMM|nr:FimV/HubP family polar landmark protein [Nitrosococcus wardiae]QBQ55474.1 tetratricopeptide repeat protein [Nitrosococcus wardiae]
MVRKTIVSVSVAGLLAASSPWEAYSLGLGGIELKSGLNQRFRAEIALHAVRDTSLEDINVKLASSEDFFRAGLDRALVLSTLRFRPLRKETGDIVVEVTSQGPIREPFLNFLLAVAWPQGQLLREYTVLLDPPFLLEPGPSIASSAASGQTPEEAAVPQKAAPPLMAQTSEPNAEPVRASSTAEAGFSTYGPTQSAETLWPIAQQVRPSSSLTPQQMMLALQRANPDAFLQNNINGLKVGQVLKVPIEEEVLEFTPAEAVNQVQQQNEVWATLLEKEAALESELQASEAAGPKERDAQGSMSEGEVKILATSASPFQLQEGVPKAQEGGEIAHLQTQLALAQETLETRTQENEGLQVRLQELEAQVKTLQQLLAAKDAQLAELEETPEEMIQEAQSLAVQGGELELIDALTLSAEELENSASPSSGDVASPPSGGELPETAPVVSSDSLDSLSAREVVANQAPQEAKLAGEVLSEEKESKLEGVFSTWMNLKNLLLLGGSSVLLLALAVLRLRKRKTTEEPTPAMAGQEMEEDEPVQVFAEKMEQVSPLEQEAVDRDDVPASPASAPIENHEAMAEADGYLASGRHHKAAKVLKEALIEEPHRQDLKLKLAEVYHAAGNGNAFAALVEEWAPSQDKDDPLWADLMAMGRDLNPSHPLFASSPQDNEENLEITYHEVLEITSDEDSSENSSDLSPWSLTSDEDTTALFSPSEEKTPEVQLSQAGDETSYLEDVGLEFDLGGMTLAEPNTLADGTADRSVEAEGEEGGIEFTLEDSFSPLGIEENLGESLEALSPNFPEFESPENAPESLVQGIDTGDKESPSLEADDFTPVAPLGDDSREESEEFSPGKTLMEDLDEMEIKLDLARAYMDMGDADGARSILEEVVVAGNEQQRNTGQELLTELAKAS